MNPTNFDAGDELRVSQQKMDQLQYINDQQEIIKIKCEPVGSETSSEIQQIWNQEISSITGAVSKIISDPESASVNDLKAIVDSLAVLQDIAVNGYTDKEGNTSYMTRNMAESFIQLRLELSRIGITAELDYQGLSEYQLNELLMGFSDPVAAAAIQEALIASTALEYEDLGLQSYVYTKMMEILNSEIGQVEDLNEYLKTADEVLTNLNELIDISTYVDIPEVWELDLSFNDPGDIPPSAVDDIQNLIEEDGGNDMEKMFAETYEAELAAAEARAETSGKTVQEEMHDTALYPPYTVNGVRTDVPTSSDMLLHFMQNGGDEQRVQEVTQIVTESIQEINMEPTLPEGETWTTVATDIWNAKLALEDQIAVLKEQGADEALIDSLQEVVDLIDQLWVDALAQNGIPTDSTFEEISTSGYDSNLAAMEDFATSFIAATQPGQDGATDLSNAVKRFEGWNEELSKDFEVMMQQLDAIIKAVSSMLKTMSDINKSYTQKM